jgi:hypothetical protein
MWDDPLPSSNEDPVGVNVWREWWRQDKEDYDERPMNQKRNMVCADLGREDHLPPELGEESVEEGGEQHTDSSWSRTVP